MSQIFISVRTPADGEVIHGKFDTIEAIVQLHKAIEHLRRAAAPSFDASWGEQPMPLIAPSASEMAASVPVSPRLKPRK